MKMKKQIFPLLLVALAASGLFLMGGCGPKSKVPEATGTPAQAPPPPEAQTGPAKPGNTDVPPPTR